MNAWGWIFMLSSLALVWGTTIWAYCRLLSSPREKPRNELPRDPMAEQD